MKKYIFLLAVLFLSGCASESNTEIPSADTNVIKETQQTTISETINTETTTTTRPKSNYLVYSVTENKVDLKLNKKVVQTIELDYRPIRDYISAQDFDFDGYTDIFIPSERSGLSGTYYHYNPETEQFEEWDELNKIGYRLTAEQDNTLTTTSYLEYGNFSKKYKWNGDLLESVAIVDYYYSKNGYINDLYEYQPDGSKILVERTYINPENNAKYKTLGRDEVVYFEVTENSVNAMRDGKILQSFENNTLYERSLSGERHTTPEKYLDTSDFDYDGYEDLFIPESADKGTYYRFNPDTERFDVWDELNKTGDIFFMEPDDENYLRSIIYRDGKYYETLVREWKNGELVLHHREVPYTLQQNNVQYKDYIDVNGVIFRRDRNSQKISVDDVDFDFDGHNDLYIPDYDEEKGIYYHYNPDMEKFEEWDELNKIGRPLTVGMSQNVRIGQILSLDTDDGQRFIYKWNGDKLNLVERCETDADNNKIWYYIDENGNEFLSEY